MWPNQHFPADLVTFTEEILNRKLQFLCNEKNVVYKEWNSSKVDDDNLLNKRSIYDFKNFHKSNNWQWQKYKNTCGNTNPKIMVWKVIVQRHTFGSIYSYKDLRISRWLHL